MHQPRTRLALLFAAVLTALATMLAGTALAQTQVQVVVQVRDAERRPAEATVTLTPQAGGQAYTCRTSGGTCRIPGVRPGTYVVTAQPTGPGSPPTPTTVPIVPSESMNVYVTLR